MLSTEIRKRYLEFFEKRGHTVVPGDLLVPRNDPTLLFTGAGMNQFKEQFMGKNITYKRAASCQKCLRTGDLENVGKTPRHHTFFEMLGNFSFGDYFKKEAISWAWQFMTEEMGFPEDRLWISVYKDDGESYSLWLNDVKVPAERVIKLGADSNFWPANAPEQGPNGPCGPCSEIFYDWGPGTGCGRAECDPSCDCGRFVEVWNLVFTEFERKPDGQLGALPNRNIDTGMGLERLASVLQGVTTNFETDLFRPITDRIRRELDEGAGGEIPAPDIYRIADHVRAAVFAVADGVSPSNEKQGYVIRKLIRRAYLRSGKKKPFLYNIVPVVAGLMKDVYPELEEKREHISAIVKQEEERFNDTLNSALPVLEDMLSGGARVLSGGRIFKLVDTYGLPLDVVVEKTEAAGIGLDIKEFERLMKRRKEESRKGSNISAGFIFQPGLFDAAPEPEFSDVLPLETTMAYILKRGEVSDEIQEGEEAQIITSPQSSELYA
ncbi:MAG: alanine--tRNA ligase, partial [Candidatus Omnitrophica bacterium]|nr:alanine--tRNA ligase [Candidatus Omnitrophota bacterium]